MKTTLRTLLMLTLILSGIFLISCSGYRVEGPGDVSVEVGDDDDQAYERGDDKKGPPPWAPAHGYRRKQAYYYYPNGDIYYNRDKKEYVWIEAGDWKFGTKLPTSLESALNGPKVSIDLEGDDPSKFHKQVKDYYDKPGNANKGKKDKGGPPKGRGRNK